MKKIMMIFAVSMVAMVGKAETKTVSYWDSDDKKMRTKECERITADTRTLVSGTWYYVEGSVEMNHGLEIGHYAYIILEDDAKLVINAPANTPGIAVRYGTLRTDYLYVYGQRSGTGKMEVHGGANAAGIGGICVDGENRHMGYMYVYGGIIEAYGGKNAAGIGGSYFKTTKARFMSATAPRNSASTVEPFAHLAVMAHRVSAAPTARQTKAISTSTAVHWRRKAATVARALAPEEPIAAHV